MTDLMTLPQRRNVIGLAVLMCLLGFGLATVGLEARSMWYDEWLSWEASQKASPLVIAADAPTMSGHPPTYYSILWIWTRLTGTQDLGLMRYTSALFGVLTIALTYRLGVLWFQDARVGLVAALFVATSSTFLYYMRELRMYTLTVLLVTASWWALHRFVHGRRGGALQYFLLLTIMAYTYYFTGFVAALQLVVVLLFYRHRLTRLLLVYAGALIVIAPWLPALVTQIRLDAEYATYGLELPLIGVVAKGAATSGTNWGAFIEFLHTYSNNQPHVIISLLVVGVFVSLRQYRDPMWWAALIWMVGVPAIFFLGNLVTPLYNVRYPLMMIPAMGLVIGFGVTSLPAVHQGAFLGVFLVFGLLTYTDAFEPPVTPHDDLLGTVSVGFQPGDEIWYNIETGARGSSLFASPSYYLQTRYTELTEDDFVWDAPNDFSDPDRVPRVWDVRSVFNPLPPDAEAEIMDGRALSQVVRHDSYEVRLYEAPPGDGVAVFNDQLTLHHHADAPWTVADDVLTVDLWWVTQSQPALDYSYALHLRPISETQTVAQADAALVTVDDTPHFTSTWAADEGPYFTRPTLRLPSEITPGAYEVWLTVYHFQTSPQGLNLALADDAAERDGNFVGLGTVLLP
ncbi:MAG: glycosyltransferase family 39 protein [Chloroflexota bacterium]